jgi:predicted GH43/DUF377 family glycosyl hydrolase
MSFLVNPFPFVVSVGGGGGPTPSIFTADQLTPKWLADGSPASLIVAKGTGGDWDLFIREIGNVIDEGSGAQRYKLTYTGHNDATYDDSTTVNIGWAYSADGTSWTKGGQLITARSLEDPYLIKVGSTYYLYAEDKADSPFRNIRLFTSTDFATWNDEGDILDIGASGAWDDQDVSSPVVWREGSTWKMLYEGRKVSGQQGAVGLATSSDGISWTKDGANPVFEEADIGWASAVVPDDIMLANDGTYVMLYHGYDGSFFRGAAVHGSDLHTWSDPLNNVSTLINLASADHFTIQFHPVGSDVHFIYARDAGAGIRQGEDMGYEVLVANFTGANGSTAFTDESAWGHTLTANGNAQIQSNKLELDGAGDYVSAADSDRWSMFAVPYTIELFGVAFDANTSLMTLIAQWTGSAATQSYRFDYRGDLSPDILRMLGMTSGGSFFFDDSGSWTPTVGQAYDLCFERSGNTLRFYVDGMMLSSTTQSETFRNPSAELLIGANKDGSFGGAAGNYLNGRMAAVRFTNGKALYATDASYTVPTLPLVPAT